MERLEKVVSELQDEKDAVNLAISIIAERKTRELRQKKKNRSEKPLWASAGPQRRKWSAWRRLWNVRGGNMRKRRLPRIGQKPRWRSSRQASTGRTDYATDEQLAEEAELGRAVRADLEKARFHLRESNVARTNAQMVAIRAAGEFNKLAETEYRLRPASKNPKVDPNFVRVIG